MIATCNARSISLAVLTAALATVLGCAGAAAPAAAGGVMPESPRGYPGFDASRYPGDEVMRAWRAPASPYRWVGYYLPAPCHRDASWAGTRARLESMGWGTAVLYVGQQAWEGSPDRQTDPAAAPTPIVCSRSLLSAERGRIEADDAIAKAAADGFPRRTVIFLDIEPMTAIPDSMRAYYRAWVARVLAEGRYRPGIYVHSRNAGEIHSDVRAVHRESGIALGPGMGVPVWIAAPSAEFSLVRAPRESGIDIARVWQGRLNFSETWSGATLQIDANVADSPSPSAPGGGG